MKFKKAKRSYPRRTRPILSHHDDVLKRNKVDFQAYHRRSFIGNHCIKYLKIKCTREYWYCHQNLDIKTYERHVHQKKGTLNCRKTEVSKRGLQNNLYKLVTLYAIS